MEFARIENDLVIDIIVISEDKCSDAAGVFNEQMGSEFCNSLIKGEWIQSGYSKSTRKNTARIGCAYDRVNNGYIYEQPFPSWTLDNVSCKWEAPVDYPLDGQDYDWDEDTLAWIKETA